MLYCVPVKELNKQTNNLCYTKNHGFLVHITYHCNTLKMKRELFLFVFLSVFVTLNNLGAQIRGAQKRYTVVNFGLNQPL